MAGLILNNAHSILMGSSVAATAIAGGAALGAAGFMYADATYNIVADVKRFTGDILVYRHAMGQLASGRNHGLYTFLDTVNRLPDKTCIRNHDFREWSYKGKASRN
ncbi:hypothetical protein HDU93_008151 [Gonapodya sp. JEL0774]|nr:hypothetical protein HDU93_008151 [Gonapodya sp. JEL0774]